MRFNFLSFDFGLLLLVLVALLQGATAGRYRENSNDLTCNPDNCIKTEQCEELIRGPPQRCEKSGESCCSVVKEEFRATCFHHGGVCMEQCAEVITVRRPTECQAPQKCCVLV
ncbi:uncharacterized protein [Venturia canescens]|uniref:uncharacterized protein n=1 Tax=Venturia canescens TaxID=32260 RepID=UPI001C9C5C75|nr:uncharacterized protein LOC122417105 [Venturia canescens]